MKKLHVLLAVILLISSQAFATYLVVLKDGTRYRAKSKWTITNGKAIIPLENGTSLQVDPALIDTAKTNQVNASGLGDSKVLAVEQQAPANEGQQVSPLGSMTKLRKLPPTTTSSPASASNSKPQPGATVAPPLVPSGNGGAVGNEVISKFVAAYENSGLYDSNVTSSQNGRLRVEVSTDNEDKVFKVISATAYMLVHVPQTTGVKLDMVELFMKTINGGAAGRFQMTSDDARNIDTKQIKIEDYFVNKVIF